MSALEWLLVWLDLGNSYMGPGGRAKAEDLSKHFELLEE